MKYIWYTPGNNTPRMQAVSNMVKQNSTSVVIRSLLQIHSRREPNNAHIELLLYDTVWILSQLALKGMYLLFIKKG